MSARIACLSAAQALAAMVVVGLAVERGWGLRPFALAAGAAAFAVVGSVTMHIELRRHAHAVTIVEAALVASLFHLAPLEVIFAATLAEALTCIVRRQPVLQVVFNATAAAATSSFAVVVFVTLPGRGPLDTSSWVAAIAAAGCYGVASHTSTSAVLAVVEGRRFADLFAASFAPSAVATVVSASIGVLVAMQVDVNRVGILLVAPLVLLMVLETRRLAAHRADHLRFKRLYAASARTGRLVTQFEAIATLADEARSLVTGAAAMCCTTDRSGRWHGIIASDGGNRLATPTEVEAALILRGSMGAGELPGHLVPSALATIATPVESLVFASSDDAAGARVVIAVARHLPAGANEARTEVLSAFVGHAVLTIANAALYADVEEALAHQVDLNRQKDEFVAAVSHELRTPLTSIIGSVSSMRRLGDKLDPDKHAVLVDVAYRQGARLKQLIEDLLLLSNIEGGPTVSRDLVDVDLRSLVTEIAADLSGPRPDGSAVDITFSAGRLPPIRCDEGKLRQIVANLVENARKYAPQSAIEIDATCEGASIVVDVIDHGAGISPENRDRVFERFVQLDQSSTRARGGTGLGLYLCRRLAAVLGGTLDLSEADGGGCRFTLSFPANPTFIDLPAGDDLVPGRAGALPVRSAT